MQPQKKFTSTPRFREVIWIRAQIILLTQGNSLVELRKNLNVTLISVFNVKCFSQSGFVDVVNKLRNRLEYFLMILFTKYLVTNNLIEEFIWTIFVALIIWCTLYICLNDKMAELVEDKVEMLFFYGAYTDGVIDDDEFLLLVFEQQGRA